MSAQAGVGLLVSPNIAECVVDWVPVGGRVCLLKLRLQERSLYILQVYAPNKESQDEAFLEEVEVALGKATSSECLVLLNDFNAHVGIDNATWKGVIGQHGDPDKLRALLNMSKIVTLFTRRGRTSRDVIKHFF